MNQLLQPEVGLPDRSRSGDEGSTLRIDNDPGAAGRPEEGLGGDLSAADQRRLRQSEAFRLASTLHTSDSLKDRIEIYRQTTRRLLGIAGALWPELMPELNGEFEWIALLTVDLE